MVRRPCCDRDREGLKRGAWTEEEDEKLTQYIHEHGDGKWHHLPKHAGIQRCGKSCRLRWVNYLRPGIKRGNFSKEEEETILFHHSRIGNKWSKIAKHLEGRTDNEIKNHYNTRLKRQLKESMQREYMIVPPEPLSSYFATLEAEAKIGRHLLNQLATTANMNIDLGILMSEFQLNEATKTTFMATNHISSSLSSLVPKTVCNDLNYQTPPHTSRPMENINNYGAYNVQSSYQHFLQKSQQRQDSVNFNSEMIIDSGYDNNILWESPNSIPLSGVVSGTYSGEVEVPSVHTILSSMINTNDYGDYTSLMDFQEYSSNSMALVDTLTLQDWLMDNGEDKYM